MSEPYQIKNTIDGTCICGHSSAAHGSGGFICAACDCKEFVSIKKQCPHKVLDNNHVCLRCGKKLELSGNPA